MIEQFSASKEKFDQIERASVLYDSRWIKQHVKSNISENDFEDQVFELEKQNLINRNQFRDIMREFRALRDKAKEKEKISASYDTKWVKK